MSGYASQGSTESRPMGLMVTASARKRSKASTAQLLGGAADVTTALGVENHRHAGMGGVGCERSAPLELILGPARGEIGNLRFEAAHQVGGGSRRCRGRTEDGASGLPCR